MDTVTTKEFCGSKKVKRPSCDKSNDVSHVVGYFEGCARARPYENFWPEQIPVGLYTHNNFAFATIDPKTFKIKANKESDLNTYRRLMLQKKKDPELKVYLAVDRAGRDVDFANFPKFMASLKKTLGANDKGLTITLPASYWYLQHFDIKKLEKTVDFFNIMSYDLHGAWDQNAT
ncbi:hypothetical protein N0V84_012490 [Fusarium piperis]|uniref:GH18 domain-containing protein n=1 Tax=Fusarium piperis TaxID=1435070 RepID=A0A9W8W287_9HYPO|nr:hypothetical protein N0V84_012490 [Fusarium piperis]